MRAWERFFFSYRLSNAHLALFRFVFFFLVGLDCWFQISHAPRYGAGDFNVGHFPFLEGVLGTPGRHMMLILYALQSLLALMIAFGRAGRPVIILLTGLFAYSYFVSQLNSYQHEWMMLLVLCALCFVSWHPRDRETLPDGDWPIRLILVVASMVYMWAIIAKVDPLWLNGKTVSMQIAPSWARGMFERFLAVRSVDPLVPWARFAVLVMVTEGALAIAIHLRWLRWPAFFVGVFFHLGIEAVGFKIGLFSYYMVALYLLVLPFEDIERLLGGRVAPVVDKLAGRFDKLATSLQGARGWVLAGAGVVAGALVIGLAVPFDRPWLVALATALAGVFAFAVGFREKVSLLRQVVGWNLAFVVFLVFAFTTDTVVDYHRYWGGSSRRLGETEDAKEAYGRLVEIAPNHTSGYLGLSRIYARSEPARALESCDKLKEIAPSDFRGFLCAAEIHLRAGRPQEALENARTASALAPGNENVRRVLQRARSMAPR